jgi:hypothetical protein
VTVIEHPGYWSIEGRECEVTIEPRPGWCDRGRFIAKVHPRGALAREFDEQDGWPRYYFDWDRMLAEIQAWLTCRGQVP